MLELYKGGEMVVEIEIAGLTDAELAAEINRALESGQADSFLVTGCVR